MSNYVVSRCPERFGPNQADFIERSNRIVEETIDTFRTAVRGRKDLTEVFHATMEGLGVERARIASVHGYADQGKFGVSRISDEGFSSPVDMTALTPPYEEYRRKMIPILQRWLRSMPHTKREFGMKQKTFREPSCFGRAMTTTVQLLCREDERDWGPPKTSKEIADLYPICGVPLPNPLKEIGELWDRLTTNKEAMARLKEKDPNAYKRLKFGLAISKLRTIDPEKRKSDYVLVTPRLKIDGKMYALTQHFTWMYRDFQQDPVERMTRHSQVALIHQDPFLIEPTLKEAAKIFKEAIECDRDDLTRLKERVLLINYLAAHAMRSRRGESAIIEWLERAIYGYHGFNVEYNQEKLLNLEALTSSLSEFSKNYDSAITLTKIDSDK